MAMTVTWETKCDGCGKKVVRKGVLNDPKQDPENDDGMSTSYDTVWGPGVPDGWLETNTEDDKILLFHDVACCAKWLRKNGENERADELENGVWIA